MTRSLLVFVAFTSSMLPGQGTSPVQVHHEANFESERKQADELFLARKPLEALPLYEDLCQQDPTMAVFAERRGTGLLAREATLSDPPAAMKVHLQAMEEFRRAQRLGDNSVYVRAVLTADSKTLVGAVLTGIPLTVGYTYRGTPAAQSVFRDAEVAFGRSDWASAAPLYVQAATLDPSWYAPALYAGDSYFLLKDAPNATLWFAKAVAIDPNRETAYRYWGDALFKAGDRDGARQRFVEAIVAEPYGILPFAELGQWAKQTGYQTVKPLIVRPEFTTSEGVLRIDPELAASTQDGRSSWIVYQQFRVAHGAWTLNQPIVAGSLDASAAVKPSEYRHTIAEEHAAFRAMLADVEAKLKAGTLIEANLDPSIRSLRALEGANVLGAWIAINAADAGIRSNYPEYRANHRKHLIEYVNTFLIRPASNPGQPRGTGPS